MLNFELVFFRFEQKESTSKVILKQILFRIDLRSLNSDRIRISQKSRNLFFVQTF